jgi:hypothetical protein
VPLLIVVAKWIRSVPLFHAKITESLPTPRTVRITGWVMVRKELMVPIALLPIVNHCILKVDESPFTCPIFLDPDGNYLKTATNSFFHKFHARCDHIRTLSTTLLNVSENQIQQDLSPARTKTSLAANLHRVWSCYKGTQYILLRNQIKALLKKNSPHADGKDPVKMERTWMTPSMTVEK